MNTTYNPGVRDLQDLGAIVRRKRKSLGMSLVTAAGLCGVGVRFLSEMERGKPTVEAGKVFQVLFRMGLEVRLVQRGHPGNG